MKKFWNYILVGMIAVMVVCGHGGTKASATEVIQQMKVDTCVIPDKYNTGAVTPEGGFTTIERGSILSVTNQEGQPMQIKLQDAGTTQKINLQYANKDLEGTILFENVNFSATMDTFTFLDSAIRKEKQKRVHFIFRNCIFKGFNSEREGNEYVQFTFENCSFQSFWGSNASMERCYFGGGIGDRITPFCRVTVKDCYIANPTSETSSSSEIHVDGTQLYGWATTEVYDVKYDGCRFEMPMITYPNASKAYVNACIMLQLEYNDGHDISFTDCYVNGGGYSVYASRKNDCEYRDTYFKNLKIGCAAKWGTVYPGKAAGVELHEDTWSDAASIYVGTVKREENSNRIQISVSNDTNQTRTFRVFTSNGHSYDFEIEACPLWKEIDGRRFEEFPFDRLYTIPETAEWIVCFDTTDGAIQQVRYVNWGDKVLVFELDSKGNAMVKEKGSGDSEVIQGGNTGIGGGIYIPAPDEGTTGSQTEIKQIKSVALKKSDYTYTGKVIRPEVVVTDEKGNVVSSAHYTVTYEKNKNVGNGIVKVTMKDGYEGTYQKSFKIRPKSTGIMKLTKSSKKKNQIKVQWTKKKTQVTGVQIQISTSRKFTSDKTKSYWIKNNKTTVKEIKNLKSGKKYYVRIRTYKTVKVNGVEKKIYSKWSTVKSKKL